MMSFFVMLVAFSTQDQQKLKIVAGSMRDAFGVQNAEARYSGIDRVRRFADPAKLKNTAHISAGRSVQERRRPIRTTATSTHGREAEDRPRILRSPSASLRQALQDLPELTEMSKHIMFEETKEGLNLEIVDQDGRSMFAGWVPRSRYERTPRLIQKLAGPLKATPLRVAIVGHTSAGFVPTRSDYGAFDLSADRANAVRQILEREGLPPSHIFSIRCPARPTPSRCFRTIRRSPPTAA